MPLYMQTTRFPENDKPSGSSGGSPENKRVLKGIRERNGKWVSEIREPRKTTRIWLGTYPSPEMAAAAYDAAELVLKGPDAAAGLNFPELSSLYPRPASSSAADIRAVAVLAAELKQVDTTAACYGTEPEINAGRDVFMDEEVLFDMPNHLNGLAEGMLMSPPRMSEDSPENPQAEKLWNYD